VAEILVISAAKASQADRVIGVLLQAATTGADGQQQLLRRSGIKLPNEVFSEVEDLVLQDRWPTPAATGLLPLHEAQEPSLNDRRPQDRRHQAARRVDAIEPLGRQGGEPDGLVPPRGLVSGGSAEAEQVHQSLVTLQG